MTFFLYHFSVLIFVFGIRWIDKKYYTGQPFISHSNTIKIKKQKRYKKNRTIHLKFEINSLTFTAKININRRFRQPRGLRELRNLIGVQHGYNLRPRQQRRN